MYSLGMLGSRTFVSICEAVCGFRFRRSKLPKRLPMVYWADMAIRLARPMHLWGQLPGEHQPGPLAPAEWRKHRAWAGGACGRQARFLVCGASCVLGLYIVTSPKKKPRALGGYKATPSLHQKAKGLINSRGKKGDLPLLHCTSPDPPPPLVTGSTPAATTPRSGASRPPRTRCRRRGRRAKRRQ
jgi:hypothetical protein